MVNVSKGANIRDRYNQVPHLTQDTNWNTHIYLTDLQLNEAHSFDTKAPFPTMTTP